MRTLRHLKVYPVHPRPPEQSYIELTLLPTDRKSGKLDAFTITEDDAYDLAEMALTAARILRKRRIEKTRRSSGCREANA